MRHGCIAALVMLVVSCCHLRCPQWRLFKDLFIGVRVLHAADCEAMLNRQVHQGSTRWGGGEWRVVTSLKGCLRQPASLQLCIICALRAGLCICGGGRWTHQQGGEVVPLLPGTANAAADAGVPRCVHTAPSATVLCCRGCILGRHRPPPISCVASHPHRIVFAHLCCELTAQQAQLVTGTLLCMWLGCAYIYMYGLCIYTHVWP